MHDALQRVFELTLSIVNSIHFMCTYFDIVLNSMLLPDIKLKLTNELAKSFLFN